MYCTNCKVEIEKDARFCNKCGTAVVEVESPVLGYNVNTVFCRNCNKELLMNSKACSNCGTATDKADKIIAKSSTFLHHFKFWSMLVCVGLMGIGFLVMQFGGNVETGVIIMVAGVGIGGIMFLIGLILSAVTFVGGTANDISKAIKKK